MHKLVIMLDALEDLPDFDTLWPQFLHQAEQMPGLRREATTRVEQILYGRMEKFFIHELFFDSLPDLHQAMDSLPGQEAGRILQRLTRGRLTLFIADHREDEIDNIRKFSQPGGQEAAGA